MSAPRDPWKDAMASEDWGGVVLQYRTYDADAVDAARAADAARYKAFRDAVAAALCVENEDGPVSDEAIIEAADVTLTQLCEESSEIATLRATVAADDERLRAAGARVGVEFGCDTADWMAERILELRSTVDQQQARITALEAALKPFAALADCYDPPEGDDHQPTWDRKPTLGQVRQARQALETP